MSLQSNDRAKQVVYQRILRTIHIRKRKKRVVRAVVSLSLVLMSVGFWVLQLQQSIPEQPKAHQLFADISAGNLTLSGRGTMDLKEALGKSDLPMLIRKDSGMVIIQMKSSNVSDSEEIVLRVGIGGFYKVILADNTVVYLNSNSELRYAGNFMEDRVVRVRGDAYFEVADKYHGTSKQKFTVLTAMQKIQVLGTQFVTTSREGKEQTVLAEGSVVLVHQKSGKTSQMLPGQMATWNIDGQLHLSKVQLEEYTSWKDGFLYFEDKSLLSILEELQHIFPIQFDPAKVPNNHFTMYLKRDKPLSAILDFLKETGNLDVDLQDGELVFSEKSKQ